MSAGHTPGPWEVDALPHNGYPYGIKAPNACNRTAGAVGTRVLRWGAFMLPSSPEALANARLIAAAPDLLVALQTLVSQRDGHFHTAAAWDAARAAIARALVTTPTNGEA